MLEPCAAALDPEALVVPLLNELAADCVQAGATVIGHLKCLLHLPAGTLACNLTSVRSGARCAAGAARTPLQPGGSARLDLAVLVYGLPAPTMAGLVRGALSRLLDPLAVGWSVDGAGSCAAVAKGGGTATFDPADFETIFPGVYTEREAGLVRTYLAANRALEERGPIDVQALAAGALPADTPGFCATLEVTEAMVRYNNAKYDPDNPLLNDAGYARSLGYQDILAMPCFGAHDDTFMVPYPPDARDTLLVSQLNHSVTNYAPVHPGDTLYLIANRRSVTDRSPVDGSTYRHVTLVSHGSVYNQRGEKINDTSWRVTESEKIYKPDKRPETVGFLKLWEAPDWTTRPAHSYTDADWDHIKALWAQEHRQGAEPLWWEDVKVGDEPAWTVDGPIDEPLSPSKPYGMGIGGSRTLRHEIMDPAVFATMVRDGDDGIYRLPDRCGHVPTVPDDASPFYVVDTEGNGLSPVLDSREIHKSGSDRAVLINILGRDLAVRHLNNWMGDHGWLRNIRWGIMPAEGHAALGKTVPKDPGAEYFLGKVPFLAGRHCMAHGLTGDLAIVKSYVYDKRVRDGEFLVELAWWIETIEGEIWTEGGATVKLPSARAAG